MPRSLCLLSLALLAVVLSGCAREESVTRYQVPKPKPVKAAAGSAEHAPAMPPMAHGNQSVERILGAIILRGDKAWFVKAAGAREAFAEHVDGLLQVIGSFRFGADGAPEWTLPAGWSRQAGSQFRFATLVPGGRHPLDISVTVLPKNEADEDYILANVNRWRGQVDLPPTDAATLRPTLKTVPLPDGQSATVVMLDAPPPEQPLRLAKYETPSGWTDRGASGLRKADFHVADGDKQAEITITSFSAAKQEMSNPLANINRWRDQIGLPATTPNELAAALKPITVNGHGGYYVEMFAPDEAKAERATLVAMFVAGGEVWFVKLSGDGQLAKRERDNFTKLLDSIRLTPPAQPEPQGATDGK